MSAPGPAAQFRAMLTGIMRRVYDENTQITPQFLMDNVYKGSISMEELQKLYSVCEKVLRMAGFEDWDVTKFSTVLDKSPLSEEQREIFIKFWKANRAKIHEVLVEKATWNKDLLRFSWRIDMQTKSKNAGDLDKTSAIVELAIAADQSVDEDAQTVVRFEMDKRQLEHTVHELDKIEAVIQSYTQDHD